MLFVVPTPIGNTEDITLRALRLFRDTKLIISENTPTTRKLLSIYDIPYQDKQFIKFTSHDHKHIHHIVSLLENQDGVLVSEAGTPGLSDPGKLLVIACQSASIPVTVLPGSTALIPAVIMAQFPTTQRSFGWFLPHKKGREKLLNTWTNGQQAVFFYESVHRIQKLLDQLTKINFEGKISVSREISKHFEQNITWSLSDIQNAISNKSMALKGEFVIGLYPSHCHHEQTETDDMDASD